MKRIGFKKTELYFFLLFSLISILPFCLVKYIPSLDGPQHLYNARLIAELIKGNEFISQFYRFNPVVVGNMSSLYIMAFLMFVFPAWLAEKIFLTFYIIGLALSFRYFIRSIQKTDSLLYLLIFPFAFTSLFMLGYYNFCVAFIPFFLALGYLKRHEFGLGIREAVYLAILGLLIFLSHAVVFVFFGLIIVMQMVFDLVYPAIFQTGSVKGMIFVIKKYLIILCALIPAAVFWVLYYTSINSGSQSSASTSFRPISEILGEIYRLRILVGFHHGKEAGSDMLLFWTLVALTLLAVIPLHRFFPRLFQPVKKNNPDWVKWTFMVIVLFLLAIFFPDRMVTGSMSMRLCILFFFGLITWISLQSYPKKIMIMSLILIMGAFTWHRVYVYQCYKGINREIANTEKAGEFINPKSIVFPINCSDSWYQLHFHCYLGVDKPIVDLRNPQTYGQMPVMWNNKKMPNILLGKMNQKQLSIYWEYGNGQLPSVSADYIFIWKSQLIKGNKEATTLMEKVNPYYVQAFKSKYGDALLYQLDSKN